MKDEGKDNSTLNTVHGNFMKQRLIWKKGAILLQTLVMSILLSMIAVMVMRWVLARYVLVGRVYRSLAFNARGEGYAFSSFPCEASIWTAGAVCPNWQDKTTGAVANGSKAIDSNPPKSFSLDVISGTTYGPSVQTIEVTGEEKLQ
ncbi:MAG: hypothetical protein KKH28_04875 [Elusimicrobia bacterium]|nr:hypothetical protein [Elusimicrobiota bacterium]